MFPPSGGFYDVAVGCDVSVIDGANIPAAIDKLEAAMTPAQADECEDWLTMLQAACARRNDSEEGASVALDLYTAALRQYPADVAKGACMQMATRRGTNWFPTLGELLQICDTLAGPRRAMLSALKRPAKPMPSLDRDTVPEPEDRKAYVNEMLAGFRGRWTKPDDAA